MERIVPLSVGTVLVDAARLEILPMAEQAGDEPRMMVLVDISIDNGLVILVVRVEPFGVERVGFGRRTGRLGGRRRGRCGRGRRGVGRGPERRRRRLIHDGRSRFMIVADMLYRVPSSCLNDGILNPIIVIIGNTIELDLERLSGIGIGRSEGEGLVALFQTRRAQRDGRCEENDRHETSHEGGSVLAHHWTAVSTRAIWMVAFVGVARQVYCSGVTAELSLIHI